MQIQFALDTANRKDVEVAHATIGYILGFLPVGGEATAHVVTVPTAVAAPAATPTAQPTTEAPQPQKIEAAVDPKPKAKKKAADPVKTPEPGALDFKAVKAKLQSYSEDPRFGMDGVLSILGRYGQVRVSALPEARYAEFVKEIDEALAGQSDPLA